MPGRKNEEFDGSYITQESAYRLGVASADTDPTLSTIPIIHLDLDMEEAYKNPAANAPVKYTQADAGHNAVIGIHAVHSVVNGTATLQLWRRLDDAAGQIPATWCLAYAVNIVGSSVVRAGSLIAGKYKVLVSALSGGNVSLAVSRTV